MKPPCTERYARWCERTAVNHRLLLDLPPARWPRLPSGAHAPSLPSPRPRLGSARLPIRPDLPAFPSGAHAPPLPRPRVLFRPSPDPDLQPARLDRKDGPPLSPGRPPCPFLFSLTRIFHDKGPFRAFLLNQNSV